MTIQLPPDLEQLIAEKVSDGTYSSEAEVVRAALVMLAERDDAREVRVEELRAWAAEGFADLDAGRIANVSIDDIKRSARERFPG